MWPATAAGLACILLLSLPAPDAAGLLREVTLDRLTRSATTIVVAEATAARSFRSADPQPLPGYGGAILTDVHLRVSRVLKGSAGRRLTITVPGGTVGGETVFSADAPSFCRGAAYVVFLDAGDQIVAWRRGQPQLIAGRVPELESSLAALQRRVARITGRAARTLGPLPADAAPGTSSTRAAGDRDGSTVVPRPAGSAASSRSQAARAGLPFIESVTPDAAPAGTGATVTIRGTAFGSRRGSVGFFVRDGLSPAEARIVSWGDTAIVCAVPTATTGAGLVSAGSGPLYVRRADGAVSDGAVFSVSFGYGGVRWPRSRCAYQVDTRGHDEWKAAVDAAAQTWVQTSGGRFRFIDSGQARRPLPRPGDGSNTVGWAAGLPADVVAAAWRSSVGGAMLEADLIFSTRYLWSAAGDPAAMDVQTVALHEFGHWLGLLDLYGESDLDKVMYGFIDQGVIAREPSADDLAGARWIYSTGRSDRARPRTAARRETVRRGKTARLTLRVKDPAHSCGAARVRIVVRGAGRRTVAIVRGAIVPTNKWVNVSYRRVRLPRGTYRWYVYATDLAGHKQVRVGSNRFIVR